MKITEFLGTFFEGRYSAKAFIKELEVRGLSSEEVAEFFNTVRYFFSINPNVNEVALLDVYEKMALGEEFLLPEKLKGADGASLVEADFDHINMILASDLEFQETKDTREITLAVIPMIKEKVFQSLA